MNFDELTEEQKAKARACTTPEEMLALAKKEGYELSDDELEAVSGGSLDWSCWEHCGCVCSSKCANLGTTGM